MNARNRWVAVLGAAVLATPVLAGVGCSDDDDKQDAGVDAMVRPDAYVGSCNDDPVPVFEGSHQVVINDLQIAGPSEGFDLNYDGQVDNLLGLLGSVANAELANAVEAGDIFIPFEFFGLDNPISDDCFNISLYIAEYTPDQDGDGARTAGAVGRDDEECNDWDPDIRPGVAEVPGDFVDNDCNGLADETGDATPSTNTEDRDGDGYSLADGDCDDRLPSDWPDAPAHWDPTLINPGQAEICGDGFDNNCNGLADEECNPLSDEDGSLDTLPVDASSLEPTGDEALIVFRSGRAEQGVMHAGPSRFEVNVPIEDRDLSLRLTYASLTAEMTVDSDNGLYLANGMLGGVLSGRSLDGVPNIAPDILGGDEDSTMLDIIVGPFGMLVALPTIGVCVPKGGGRDIPQPILLCDRNDDCGDTTIYRCNQDVRVPDIDVDGDGIEIFLDLNLDDDDTIERVDTCIDGDGTVVFDELDTDGSIIEHCTQAMDGPNERFVDGYSIALKFGATPTILRGIFSNF